MNLICLDPNAELIIKRYMRKVQKHSSRIFSSLREIKCIQSFADRSCKIQQPTHPDERLHEAVEESKLPHLEGLSKPPVLLFYNLTGLESHTLAPLDSMSHSKDGTRHCNSFKPML